jgi:hypothetical protein
MSLVYANILIHEVFWRGLLGKADDPSQPGTVAGGFGRDLFSVPIKFTPQQVKLINQKLKTLIE